MARLASIDVKSIPDQIWYENLRDSDDGSFGKLDETMRQRLTESDKRQMYLRKKLISPSM
jgi:hypothetical protein